MVPVSIVDLLERQRCVRLTTFRRDSTPVATPVWLVRDGDEILVISGSGTGKVKRLRHTPRVLLAPCNQRGRVKAGVADVEATAVLSEDAADVARLVGLLSRKYGVLYRLAEWANRRRGSQFGAPVQIRLSLRGPAETGPTASSSPSPS